MSGPPAGDHPRVLVLAADEIVTDFSTGITVANLFADWPEQRVAQVYLIPSTGQGERLTGRSVGLTAHGGVLDVPVRWVLRVLRRVAPMVRSAVRRGHSRATPAAQQATPSSHDVHPHPEASPPSSRWGRSASPGGLRASSARRTRRHLFAAVRHPDDDVRRPAQSPDRSTGRAPPARRLARDAVRER